jgi:hypothetical protein
LLLKEEEEEGGQELGRECLKRACGSGSERCCVELCQLAMLGRVDVAVGVRCGDGSGVRVVLCIPDWQGAAGTTGSMREHIYSWQVGAGLVQLRRAHFLKTGRAPEFFSEDRASIRVLCLRTGRASEFFV